MEYRRANLCRDHAEGSGGFGRFLLERGLLMIGPGVYYRDDGLGNVEDWARDRVERARERRRQRVYMIIGNGIGNS